MSSEIIFKYEKHSSFINITHYKIYQFQVRKFEIKVRRKTYQIIFFPELGFGCHSLFVWFPDQSFDKDVFRSTWNVNSSLHINYINIAFIYIEDNSLISVDLPLSAKVVKINADLLWFAACLGAIILRENTVTIL